MNGSKTDFLTISEDIFSVEPTLISSILYIILSSVYRLLEENQFAPPGIEILFLLMLLFFIFVGVAIAVGIASLMTRLFKVRIKFKGIVFIVLLFLVFFSISSLLPRGKEDGVTVGFFGDPRRYEGSHLFYGFPEIWFRKFEPYDPSVRNLFLFPNNYYYIGFFVDFTFWLAISVILVYSVKSLSFSHHKDTGKKYDGEDREMKLKLQ